MRAHSPVRRRPRRVRIRLGAAEAPPIEVFGPAEAPVAMIRGRFRFRLLVKARRTADLQGFLRRLLKAAPKPTGSLKVAVDVEPQSFL